jgi:hypothetical protein
MKGGTLAMSVENLNRLKVLEKLKNKQLRQVEAATQLGLTPRQIRRLEKRYNEKGAEGLIPRYRGKPGNNRLSDDVKKEAMDWVRKNYIDFGPTLAHEKLQEIHQLKLSVESVRQLMMNEELWTGKKRKNIVVHQQRTRRSCLGELVQLDGSPHDWFEGRAEKCCLLVWVDDATSRLLHLRFEPCETTWGYFRGMKDYLKKHGCPVCLYPDRHSIFRNNTGSELKELDDTQFTRAMKQLGIKVICARSPQAKGRVERANGTLQDRLIKELRLRKINDIKTANDFLPTFMEDYNRRFGVEPKNPTDSHQRELPDDESLDLILSYQETRKLSKNLELSYYNTIYQIQTKQRGYRLRHARVLVSENSEGQVTLWHQGKKLPYTTQVKQKRRTEIMGSKEKDAKVDEAVKIRQGITAKPAADHPWKRAAIAGVAKRDRRLSKGF